MSISNGVTKDGSVSDVCQIYPFITILKNNNKEMNRRTSICFYPPRGLESSETNYTTTDS